MAGDKAIDPIPEKKWQIEQKWVKQNHYRGSQYPPFSIEPVPYERQRLAGSGMSVDDRALRKQWVQDQKLSPNEPRYVKELYPRNFFRRMYMGPTDAIFSKLIPVIGKTPASMVRYAVPKLMIATVAVYWAYYHMKYNHKDWTREGGFHVYTNKPIMLRSHMSYPEKTHDDYNDQGFKFRTALLQGKTSGQV